MSLMRWARERCDILVASVFVNPAQFGPGEDLDKYPADLARDAALAGDCGVDVLFCPNRETLFADVLAGEILIAMIAYLAQVAMPAVLQPFYIFELFISGIQAYIFFILSTVFISLGLAHHGGDEEKQTHDNSSTSSGRRQIGRASCRERV